MHHVSQSTSAIISLPEQPGSPAIAITPDVESAISSSSSDDHHLLQHVRSPSNLSPRPIRRSITPDPGAEKDAFDPYAEFIPLTRVSTAPLETVPAKDKQDHERQNDNKLSRMGFSTMDGRQSSAPLPPPHTTTTKSRFGLKSFVQTLKGRT
jgi:hypothetical protein